MELRNSCRQCHHWVFTGHHNLLLLSNRSTLYTPNTLKQTGMVNKICEQSRRAIAVSNISEILVRKIIKPLRLQEYKSRILFCLIAQEAPALLRHLSDQTVNTSNSAILECQVHGVPEPQISWFKNHEEIQQQSGESSVYSPTFYSLFIYPSALGSLL